jgi:murein peptide amidase A
MRILFLGSALCFYLSACASNSGSSSKETVSTPTENASVALATSSASSKHSVPSPAAPSKQHQTGEALIQIADLCEKSLSKFAGKSNAKVLHDACAKVDVLPGCQSVNGTAIYHYDRKGEAKKPASILVMSLIHGDETPAGSVGRFWMERLETIAPRNNWRVIPVVNPDGVQKKTRTNANKVDINRNFPTEDWTEKAHAFWQRDAKSSPRRFPGNLAASEPETGCVLKQIEDFKPDFVVAIHTPLKVLDYDGPKVKPPKFDYLPWKSLGHYPGSLGRYMWFERQVPVLTMELKEDLPSNNEPWLKLQDIIGVLVGLESMSKKETTQP